MSAQPEDAGHDASMHTPLAAPVSTQIWYEWVDGASNPSDDLSSVGETAHHLLSRPVSLR